MRWTTLAIYDRYRSPRIDDEMRSDVEFSVSQQSAVQFVHQHGGTWYVRGHDELIALHHLLPFVFFIFFDGVKPFQNANGKLTRYDGIARAAVVHSCGSMQSNHHHFRIEPFEVVDGPVAASATIMVVLVVLFGSDGVTNAVVDTPLVRTEHLMAFFDCVLKICVVFGDTAFIPSYMSCRAAGFKAISCAGTFTVTTKGEAML